MCKSLPNTLISLASSQYRDKIMGKKPFGLIGCLLCFGSKKYFGTWGHQENNNIRQKRNLFKMS